MRRGGGDRAASAAPAFNDGKAAANAAGALGNLARNSPLLAPALAAAGAPQALIETVEEEAGAAQGVSEGGEGGEREGLSLPSALLFEHRDGGSPLAVALFSLGTMVSHRPLFDPAGAGSPPGRRWRCEASARLEGALDALDRRVAEWRRRRALEGEGGEEEACPPPATTVVEKYAARVRAKLEAASRAS